MPLYVDGIARVPWPSAAADFFRPIVNIESARFWPNVAAHVLMLHGIVPWNWLPYSALTFSPPGWSLSLEWQFYLVAPFIILIIRRPWGAATLLFVCAISTYLMSRGMPPSAASIGTLASAGPLFALGIASRLAWPALRGRITRPTIIACLAIALIPLSSIFVIGALIWTVVFAFMCADERNLSTDEEWVGRSVKALLEHPIAQYWGERSYSVYLCHFTVLSLAIYVFAGPSATKGLLYAVLLVATVCGTALVSCLTYRWIERPGINFGKRLGTALPLAGTARAQA